jgi:hypothetical protein
MNKKRTLRISFFVLAGILLLLLSSCLQVNTTVKVNTDGSGTVEERFLMSHTVVEMMAGFQSMGEGSSSDDKDNLGLFDQEELASDAEKMGEGVRLSSVEPLDTSWGQGYLATYAFDDINKVRVNQNPGDNMPSGGSMMGEEQQETKEYITFSFRKGNPAVLEVMLPQEAQDPDDEAEDQDMPSGGQGMDDAQMMAQYLNDMRIQVQLVVNGRIVETNASYRDGNTVTLMDMDFEKILSDPDAFQKLNEMDADSLAEMRDVVESVPGIQVELKEKLSLRFR